MTEIRADADLMLFAREQLTAQLEKVSNRAYPALKIANGSIMPVVTMSGYEWENEVVITEFDSYGIAQVLAAGAHDGGKVGVVARRMRYPIKTISDYTHITWLTIRQAKAKNLPIESRYADALRMGIDKKINAIGYDGDPDYGLQGLFTSQLPRMNAASTIAAAANGDAMLSILNNAVSSVVGLTQSIWLPKLLVMPTGPHQVLANTYRTSGSDKTVLQAFMETQGELGQIERIEVDNSLKGKGDGGTDAMLVLPFDQEPASEDGGNDPEGANYPIYFALPHEFDIPSEFMQWHDTVYMERAIARVGGVVVTEPLTGLIVSGI